MAGYTRQSSFSDGDTITAALFNNEYNQLVNAFNVSSGHTHDGSTTGDGGPISTLFSNTLTFGTNAESDIAITFNAASNDGVLTWKEDEDYFEFSDDLLIATTEKIQFRDTAIYINSSTDGQLDLVADTEIQIAATTVDINGNADISGNLGIGGNLTVTGTTTFNANSNDGVITWMEDEDYFQFSDDLLLSTTEKIQFRDTAIYINSSTDGQLDLVADTEIQIAATTVDINGNVDISGSLTLGGTTITATGAELNILDGVTATATELNILDGVTSTTAELNILDGVTSTTAELNILDGVTSTAAELNLVDGITPGTVSASKAVIVDSNKDLTGIRNLTIAGDLTISGDDLTMATNTAGHLLIADGTNYNPTAV